MLTSLAQWTLSVAIGSWFYLFFVYRWGITRLAGRSQSIFVLILVGLSVYISLLAIIVGVACCILSLIIALILIAEDPANPYRLIISAATITAWIVGWLLAFRE